MENTRPSIVLLVEDDPGDQKLVRYALGYQQHPSSLKVVASGEEALDYLQHSKEGDETTPRPDIILLDLNMPGMGGKKFLKNMKSDEHLCTIPVIVVSTSDCEQDIEDSYKLHAAGYVQKSHSIDKLKQIVRKLIQYWFGTSLLANKQDACGNRRAGQRNFSDEVSTPVVLSRFDCEGEDYEQA